MDHNYNYTDVDECNAGMDICADHASCMDTDGSFMCTCNTGYAGDGMTCNGKKGVLLYFDSKLAKLYCSILKYTDIDECSSGSNNCAEQAFCMNTDGSFYCVCNTGYSGDGITCTGMVSLEICFLE